MNYKYLLMQKKRVRSENFSDAEKDLLISVVENYKDVIENKGFDNATLRKKEIAWHNLTDEFNSQNQTTRSIQALKTCWGNLKKRYRRFLLDPAHFKKDDDEEGEKFFQRRTNNLRRQAEKINSVLLSTSSCDVTSNPKVITLRVQAAPETDNTTTRPAKIEINRKAPRPILCKPPSSEKLSDKKKEELVPVGFHNSLEEDKNKDIHKLDIEAKKLDLEAKRLDIEAKRLDIETKKLDIQTKKLKLEYLTLKIEDLKSNNLHLQ